MDSLLAELKLNVKNFKIFDLGLSDFQKVYDFQKNIFKKVNEATLDSAFIICQHYPVITVGRSSRKDDLLVSESELKTRNIEIIYTERGGGLTYHGPGQLLIYPILNLNYLKRDINFFLRWLEELAIFILNNFNIVSERRLGFTGVWVGSKKIASIGIAIKRWITFHGISINIKEGDLENFSLIRPCGMDIIMTSIEKTINRKVSVEEVKAETVSILRRFL